MEDTMRDLLSKLDAIVSETALKDKDDLAAKKQALADLESDPVASADPEISAAIKQRKSDLEKEAKAKGFEESEDLYQVGDDFGISLSDDFEIGTEIVDILEDGIVIELDDTAFDYLSQNGFTFESVQLDEEKQKGLDGKACWKGYRRQGTKMKGGKSVDNCVKVGENFSEGSDSLEGAVARILKTFDENMNEIGGYGDPDQDKIVELLRQGDVEGAVEVVWYAYTDQDGGEIDMDAQIEDLEAEFEELAQNSSEDEGGETDDGYALASAGFGNDEDYESLELEAKYQGKEVPLGKKLPGDVKKSKVYVRKPNGKIVKVNFGDKKMRIKKSNPKRRKSFRARHNCSNPGPRWKARYWSCRSW